MKKEACKHWWELTFPELHETIGTCRHCGETRSYEGVAEHDEIEGYAKGARGRTRYSKFQRRGFGQRWNSRLK